MFCIKISYCQVHKPLRGAILKSWATRFYFVCCLKGDFNVSSSLEAYFDGLHLAICENKLNLATYK